MLGMRRRLIQSYFAGCQRLSAWSAGGGEHDIAGVLGRTRELPSDIGAPEQWLACGAVARLAAAVVVNTRLIGDSEEGGTWVTATARAIAGRSWRAELCASMDACFTPFETRAL